MLLYQDPLFTGEEPAARWAIIAGEAAHLPPLTGNAWRDAIIDRVVHADNHWSRDAERRGTNSCGGWLADAARADLRHLQALATTPPPGIGPAWGDRPPLPIARTLAGASDWAACLPDLARHHAAHGCGDFLRFPAFRWRNGQLAGVPHPDAVAAGDLVGYTRQRAALAANTECFLRGLPAQDVLLYGDRGTGKSSSVKALLAAYGVRGLRLIEAGRDVFHDFSDLAATVRGRRQRFVLFLDDLSFEPGETEYKALKAALQGGLEARPDNLLVYATSNRRHLVREEFAEREGLHGRDTVEEKVSLADRFGLTLTYAAPGQEDYLAIVAGICRARGVAPAPGRLRERALQWAMWGHGLSGRTARQFVETLVAEGAEAGATDPGDADRDAGARGARVAGAGTPAAGGASTSAADGAELRETGGVGAGPDGARAGTGVGGTVRTGEAAERGRAE